LEEETLRQINVENEYQRALKLHDKSLISEEQWEQAGTNRYVQNKKVLIAQSEFDLLKEGPKAEELLSQDAEIKRLRAQADYLEEQIADCTIRVPFKGQVTLFGLKNEIISVTRTDTVEITVRVPEDQIDILAVGQKMDFRVAGYPRHSFESSVEKVIVSSQSDGDKNHFTAIGLAPNRDGLLKDGMRGYAKINCGRSSVANNAIRKIVRFFRIEFWSWW